MAKDLKEYLKMAQKWCGVEQKGNTFGYTKMVLILKVRLEHWETVGAVALIAGAAYALSEYEEWRRLFYQLIATPAHVLLHIILSNIRLQILIMEHAHFIIHMKSP